MLTPISAQAIHLTEIALQTTGKLSCLSPEVIEQGQYTGEAYTPEEYKMFLKAEEILDKAIFSCEEDKSVSAKISLLSSMEVLSEVLTNIYDEDEASKTYSHAIGVRKEKGIYQFFDSKLVHHCFCKFRWA